MQMLGSRQGMGGGGRSAEAPSGAEEGAASRPAASKPAAKSGGKFDDFEDDIPF